LSFLRDYKTEAVFRLLLSLDKNPFSSIKSQPPFRAKCWMLLKLKLALSNFLFDIRINALVPRYISSLALPFSIFLVTYPKFTGIRPKIPFGAYLFVQQ